MNLSVSVYVYVSMLPRRRTYRECADFAVVLDKGRVGRAGKPEYVVVG